MLKEEADRQPRRKDQYTDNYPPLGRTSYTLDESDSNLDSPESTYTLLRLCPECDDSQRIPVDALNSRPSPLCLRIDFFLEHSWVEARLEKLGSLELDKER